MQFANGAQVARLGPGRPVTPAGRAALQWRKSQASNPSGNCVELAALPDGGVAVRNSRHPAGPVLVYSRAELGAFLAGAREGEFDDLAS
jgi:hypothetical protein